MSDILKEYKDDLMALKGLITGQTEMTVGSAINHYNRISECISRFSATVTEQEDEINRLRALEYTVERAIKTVQADRDYNGEVG